MTDVKLYDIINPMEVVAIKPNDRNFQAQCLQDNLSSIRRIAGWTAEQLGEKIGVTKQTISNLENKKTPMNLTQYIAIRSVLDYEMLNHPENTVLPQALDILVDRAEALDEKDRVKAQEAFKSVSAVAMSAGIATGTLGVVAASILGIAGLPGIVVGGAIAGAIVGTSGWLKKIMKKEKG